MAAVPSIGAAPGPSSRSAAETSDLYERYHRQIFAFCVRELGNREEAEDATQSTFLNAFRALESGTVFEHESAWLYQAAHHVCQTRRRSWYRRRRVESDGDFDRLQHILASPTRDDDELFGLRPALESMPEQQRKALLLREWQGLSYAEIAAELELSQSAVETLLFRARRGLAERLADVPVAGGKLSRIGRTGDFGSLGAAIKALLFSGGVKVAATLATVAATTVVASAPSVRNDVVHFVAPSLPRAASSVTRTAPKTKPVAARDLSVHVPAIVTTPAAVQPKAPRVVHQRRARRHVVRVTHAARRVAAKPAVTTTTAPTPTTTHVSTTTAAPAAVPVTTTVPTATQPATTTTDPAPTTSTTTTTTATTTTPQPPARDFGSPGRARGDSAGAFAAIALPSLSGFSPASGPTGTIVAISGGPFSGITSVKFNGAPALFSGGSTIYAKVPDDATSGPITVTNAAGTATTAGSFGVVAPPPPPLPKPALFGFSPRTAAIGATVLIVGAHLTGATSVSFDGIPATFMPGSDTQLTAVVPAGATSGTVSVTTPQGTVTSSATVTILAPPTVSSFSPTSGATGTTVTISGSQLRGSASVRFNGAPANVLSSSDSSISVQVPSSATSGPITVTTSNGTITAGSFTIVVPPTLAGFSPSSGAPGTAVTISGTQFTGTTAVTLNGTAAAFTVVSDSQLTVTVPTGATSGAIVVTTPTGSVTSSSAFTASSAGAPAPAPAISSVSPGFARAGTAVTIAGSHLTGATSVTFNGVTASFTVDSDAQITATVPSGARTGPVAVTTPSGTATASFVVFH